MQLWKVTFKDGSCLHLYAESRRQIETQALSNQQRLQVFSIYPVVRHPCDDRTNPWEHAGLPGHKFSGRNLEIQNSLVPILG